MSVRAQAIDIRQKFRFAVEISGFRTALFTKCDLPKETVGKVKFDQAGTLHPINMPGRHTYNDITAEKGMLLAGADTQALDWLRQTGNPVNGVSLPKSKIVRDVDLHLLNPDGTILETFTLKGAWCMDVEFDKAEAGSEDPLIEKMMICYDYFTRK